MPDPLVVLLVTLGDPNQLSGGYLYHRRLADLAPAHGVRWGFVSVPEGPFPLPALAARRLADAVLGERPHAVLIDSIVAAYLAPAVRRLAAVPLLGSLHQPPGGIDHSPLRTRVQARLDLLVYRQAALLLVASEQLADQTAAAGVPRRRLRVVPPGRDVAPAPAAPPGDLRRGRAAAVLCVANWVPRKGILALLDALADLPADAVTLHLVGDPDVDPTYAARVRARLATPSFAGRVVVHGPVSTAEVAALYQAADVFALPSIREPFGTVYGEAMALGLPVVGFAAGNLPYLATDGVEGRIVPTGDVPALAQALLQLARDEPLRHRLGEAARQRALTRPTWADTAERFFGAVRTVVNTRRAAAQR
jgi:glycosyltransferase involved in cell wall biosynthesis